MKGRVLYGVAAVLIGGVPLLAGCSQSTPDSRDVVKDIQSQNKPQQEMPDHLKGRGMTRGGGPANK